MLEKLVTQTLKMGSNDLHIKAGAVPKTRIFKELVDLDNKIVTTQEVEDMLLKMLGEQKYNTYLHEMDLDFAYEVAGYRLRVNAFNERERKGFIVRVIPSKIPEMESLNLPPVVKDMALKPKGIILVTGPASCGKSTTVASIVDFINSQENTHIITLEQPIEFKFFNKKALLDQREVGSDTESFLTGLRYALRQDPDIVMVGEMRDLETISTAITTAETGHLVLSTLHTSSAVGTINRIVNSFPPHQREEIRTQISLSIQGVISQILVPNAEKTTLIPVFEILYPNYGIRNLIRTNKIDQIESIMQTDQTCTTLRKELLKLISDGTVKEEDARKYVHLED